LLTGFLSAFLADARRGLLNWCCEIGAVRQPGRDNETKRTQWSFSLLREKNNKQQGPVCPFEKK
jgi:hypothetical protein